MDKSQTILLSGSTGVIGSSIKDYFTKFFPEVKITCLFTPFSLQNIHDHLKDGSITYFINAAGAPSNDFSKKEPFTNYQSNTIGVLNQLEMIRRYSPNTKYLNFGSIYENDNTPYASSKRISRDLIKTYRENYGLFCVQPILGFTEYYNRTPNFITRKISKAVAKIYHEIKEGKTPLLLKLENVEDEFNFTWGGDMADGVWKILQSKYPESYTIINPKPCSLYDFAAECCRCVDLSPQHNIIRKVSNRAAPEKPKIDNHPNWTPLYSYRDIAFHMTKFDIKNYGRN